MESNRNENKYLKAKEQVDKIRKFYRNLTSFTIVITGLAGLNYNIYEWRYMWSLWAAFGWGLGILFHAIRTYNLNPFFGKQWEERKIKEFLEKEQNSEIKKWK